MKKQASSSAKMFLKKFTVARLMGYESNETEKNMTDSDTVTTSFLCKAFTL